MEVGASEFLKHLIRDPALSYKAQVMDGKYKYPHARTIRRISTTCPWAIEVEWLERRTPINWRGEPTWVLPENLMNGPCL